MNANHEELFTNLKRTLAAFLESTDVVDKEILKEQLEELRDNIVDHIELLEAEIDGEEEDHED